MQNAKNAVSRMLESLPDDCNLDDIQYHIHVMQKIEQGLQDIKEGNTYTQEEVEEKLSKWIIK